MFSFEKCWTHVITGVSIMALGLLLQSSAFAEPANNATNALEPTSIERTADTISFADHENGGEKAQAMNPLSDLSRSSQTGRQVGTVALFLIIILSVIVGLAWLINKTRLPQLAGKQSRLLEIKASLALGMKEKLAVVQVGEQQLLIGITPQQITYLTALDKPLSVPEEEDSFQQLLKKTLGK